MEILWLGQPECHEIALVGGKAANLSLLAAQHAVPPGFCLTAGAFRRWAEPVSAAATHGSPRPALPADALDRLEAAYAELQKRCGLTDAPSVAVRSSAIDEDGAGASFAGQHETYLNVSGVAGVAEAVRQCWTSAFHPRALEYRRQHGLSTGNICMAVLVQQLVPADVAGVVFSANPVTGSREEVVVNASWGLGESIVSGIVTPDTYVVRKADLVVIDRQVAEKQRMTVCVPGGTQHVDVPRILRSRPAVDDAAAQEIARLALALERSMGGPVDVEWAWQSGRLYLLQCRPITTL